MVSATEALQGRTQIGADLAAGLDQISYTQTVVFIKYVRLVLPLDGYVFWVRADLLSTSALYNAGVIGKPAINQAPGIKTPAATLNALGSLHYTSQIRQDEEETFAQRGVIFSSEVPIQDFNTVNPNVLFIATVFDPNTSTPIQFAFSGRGRYYAQANEWHYYGDVVYPDMATQIVDGIDGLDTRNVIVSNSLPLWLALNQYQSAFTGLKTPLTLYPSFLAPQNLIPPWGTVHIENTEALTAAPAIDTNGRQDQLCKESVRITLWGQRNFAALTFVDTVNEYSVNQGTLGIMNMPVVRDVKRTQAELQTIAQKKVIDYEVSYLQSTAISIARQLITSAFVTFEISQAA